ncbi:MAG: HesA/MoeB/ThiF family protein [Solirubrobacterales bacterium]
MSDLPASALTASELDRYGVQLAMPEWGSAAQARLLDANAFVVGAGALGGPVGAYLAGAGVGRIAVIDGGSVEVPGLHRQFLHYTPEVGIGKADSVAAKLALLNPATHVDPFPAYVDAGNVDLVLDGADVVIDTTNDSAVRELIGDSCVSSQTPLIAAAADALGGRVAVYVPRESPCIGCAFAGDRRPGAESLGPVSGVLGSLQALVALKLLAGLDDAHAGQMIWFDGRDLSFRRERFGRRPGCTCADGAGPCDV